MDQVIGYIVTGLVTFIVGLLLQRFAAKPRLLYWVPGSFLFELNQPKIKLRTDSLTIQNAGRLPATNLEIVHKSRPDHFQFSTPISYIEEENPSGEHITRIKSLGPGEHINIQYLSYNNLPVLSNIRSDYGQAKPIKVWLQQMHSTWVYALAGFFVIVGFGFSVYWLVRSVIYLSGKIGVV